MMRFRHPAIIAAFAGAGLIASVGLKGGAGLLGGTAYAATKASPGRGSAVTRPVATGAVAKGPAATGSVDARSAAARGKAVFQAQCATCHGQGPGDDGAPRLPGTDALHRKYSGDLPGPLEKRTDLNADMIRMFVRNGSGAMPMFRKVELSDAAVDDIAAYLRMSSRQ